MRNTLRLLGIIALAVIIGFSMVACDNGTTSSTTTEEIPTKEDYDISGLGTIAFGTPVNVTITPKTGKSSGAVTKYYNEGTAVPSAPGTYVVTFSVAGAGTWKAASGLYAGVLIISANTAGNLTPAATDYDITGLSAIENGTPRPIGIAPKDGTKSKGLITIKYNGSTTAPSSKGTYDVTFDVASADGWNAASGLIAGTLTITDQIDGAARPVRDDFDVYGLGTFDYNGKALYNVSITPKDGKSKGTITIRYNGDASIIGMSDPGTYTVTFDVAAAEGWLSASGIEAGILKINAGEEVLASFFDISGLSQVYVGNLPRQVKIAPTYGYTDLLPVNVTYEGIGVTKYGPSASAPSVAGQFTVKFDVDASAAVGFKNARGLDAGTMTIGVPGATPGTLAFSNFVVEPNDGYSAPWNTTYDLLKKVVISVKPAEAVKGDIGIITVYYQKDGTATPTTVSPVDVGRYAVTFDVAESAAYSAASFPAGSLFINVADALTERDVIMSGVGESVTYNANPKPVSISVPKLTSTERVPNVIVLYDLDENPPTNAGTYNITFDLQPDPNGNWKGQSGVPAGTLTIKKGDPNRSDFNITPSANITATYGDSPAPTGFVVVGKGDVTTSNGAIQYIYSKAGAADSSTVPTDAGTYSITAKIVGTSNWNENTILFPDQKLIINKRDPAFSNFKLTSASPGYAQSAYVVKDLVFEVDTVQSPRYPNTPPKPTYWATDGKNYAVNAINQRAPQTYEVRLTLPEIANWNAATLKRNMVVGDQIFSTVDDFIAWYKDRSRRSQSYSVTFSPTTAIPSATGNPELVKLTNALKDPENVGKYVDLDLTNGTNITDFSGAFVGCENITGLNLAGSGITTISGTTFDGLSRLTSLILPATLTPVTLPTGAFKNLSALKVLDLGSITTLTATSLNLLDADGDPAGKIQLRDLTMASLAGVGYVAAVGSTPAVPSVFDSLQSLKTLTIASGGVPEQAFKNSGLTAVTLTNIGASGKIGANAFENCQYLNSVTFPAASATAWADTGASIDTKAFNGCKALFEVTIPNFAGTIANDAFGNETSPVTTVTLGGSGADGTTAFAGKKKLATLTLLQGVTGVAANSYKGCSDLLTVVFPDTLFTTINNGAFEDCIRLSNGTTANPFTVFPGTITTIGTTAFKNCENITSVNLTGLTTPAGAGAFQNSGLTSVTIPTHSGVTSIQISTFAGCTSLASVALPNTDAFSILANAFDGCTSLRTITGNTVAAGDIKTGVIVLPATATVIGNDAFKNCTQIASVELNTVDTTDLTNLGLAFLGCTSFRTLTVVSAVALDGTNGNLTFTTATVPAVRELVLDIPSTAKMVFTGLTGLTKLTVKKTQTAPVGSGVFTAANPDLKTLEINTQNQVGASANTIFALLPEVTDVIIGTGGTIASPTALTIGNDDASIFNATKVKNVTFTGVIGTLGTALFTGHSDLTVSINTNPATSFTGVNGIKKVILNSGVNNIGPGAFNSTDLEEIQVIVNDKYANWANDGVLYEKTGNNITSLIQFPIAKTATSYGQGSSVPETLTGIGGGAFGANTTLTTLTIPSSIRTIGAVDFSALSNVATVNYNAVTATVTGATAFGDTGALDTVNIGSSVQTIPAIFAGANITEIVIPASVTGIAQGAFTGCALLATVEFNANQLVTTGANGAFQGLTSIKTIRIGSNVTAIPLGTFKATGVQVVRLPGIITIGEAAFENCAGLTFVSIGGNCEGVGENAFLGCALLTTIEINSPRIVTFGNTPFVQKAGGSTGTDLVELYVDEGKGAGTYSWISGANSGWEYVSF
jgi:hypothetical protein